jgi:hypothetical protein
MRVISNVKLREFWERHSDMGGCGLMTHEGDRAVKICSNRGLRGGRPYNKSLLSS